MKLVPARLGGYRPPEPLTWTDVAGDPATVSADLFGMCCEGLSNATQPNGAAEITIAAPFAFFMIWRLTGSTWAEIEPTQGNRDYTALQAIISRLRTLYGADLKIGWCPYASSQWASGSSDKTQPPTDNQYFADFMADAASVIGDDLFLIQPINEMNDTGSWGGSSAQALSLCEAAYTAWKGVNTSAIFVTPSTVGAGGPAYMTTYLAAGGSLCADAPAIHNYPSKIDPSVDRVIERVQAYKAIFTGYPAFDGQPIYGTEGSYGPNTYIADQDPDRQVGFLAEFFARLAWEGGVATSAWYAAQPKKSNGRWGGLYDIDTGELTACGVAWPVIHSVLVGATPTHYQRAGVIRRIKLTRPGGYQAEWVWNNTPQIIDYIPDIAATQCRDMEGNTVAFSGTAQLPRWKPLLFETGSPA